MVRIVAREEGSAASIASLRVTPPISSTRLGARTPFSSRAITLLAMLSCNVWRMSSAVASLRLSLWVMSDLQWTEQREASGTTLPSNDRRTASSMPSPIRPICCTKNSPLPAAHLLCDRTLVNLPSTSRYTKNDSPPSEATASNVPLSSLSAR